MNLFEEINQSKLCLVLISEKEYENKIMELAKHLEKKSKICYVCLSKPYKDVIEQFEKLGTDTSKFFFVDVLSSHYIKPKSVKNCIFVEGPEKLSLLSEAISKAIKNEKCQAVIFDTISSLLIYEHSHDIIKFTHDLTFEFGHEDVNKIFIMLKESNQSEGSESLIKDISMFTDKTIDFKE